MPTQWSTFPMEFKGGLISNLTPLQQGVNAIGSATVLQNFEANKEGGYSKLKGFSKFSDTEVPGSGDIKALKVVSSGRAVVARQIDNSTLTEFQTATSTVNNTSNTVVNYTVTVVNDSGQDKFAFNGVTAPALTLNRGFTYIFDVSDSSVSGHPLGFKDAGGSAFTSGVTSSGTAGSSGATVTIVMPTSGTEPALYYCVTHGNAMGNSITTTTSTFVVTVVSGNPANHPYYNVGSTNKYAIGGSTATADVALSLNEGATYRFDQSASSNAGHPLRFSTTANGTHASPAGTQYTTGVTVVGTPGSSGAYTEITVALGAPPLFYYCSSHSGMGWSIATVGSSSTVTLDNNRATAVVNGATTSTKNVVVDRVRPFTAVTGTASGNGTSATFDVTNTNGTYAATVNAGGADYAVNETVVIAGTNLGGASTANDLTATVTSVAASVLYSSAAYTYSGGGTGLLINVTRNGGSYSVAIGNAGTGGYKVGETLTVAGTALGGATTANDATVTINSINNVAVTHTNPNQSGYGGSGTNATFNITRSSGSYSVAIANAGTSGYKVGETITVVGTQLDGATTANDATITIGSVNSVSQTYTNPTQSGYGGSGTSATFNVTRDAGTYTVAIGAAGSGYAVGETITIVGTQLDGATTANDATITVSTVDGSGAITAVTIAGTSVISGTIATASIAGTAIVTGTVATVGIAGTAVTTGPITGISIAGTGAAFGTITKGMLVTGTGITGTVTVKTVTSQTAIVLDTAVSLADNVALSFITNIKVGMFVTGTGISGDVTVATIAADQNSMTLSSGQTNANFADNTVFTFGTFSSSQVGKTVYFYGTGTDWTQIGTSTATNTLKSRHFSFNFTGVEKTLFVDGKGYPGIYESAANTMSFMSSSDSADIEGSDNAVIFKNTAFFAKGHNIFFTAPATIDDFSVANGAGTINVANDITGMIVFREQLIIFTTDTIKRLVGNTASDFTLEPITDKIGCTNSDTIQEFGGDIIYLSPDGIRLLGATDRIGDFALDVASDSIVNDAKDFIAQTDNFCSVLVRNKSQYRIFSYLPSVQKSIAQGLIATKFISQGGEGISWATTKGIKANVADSTYAGSDEVVMFANNDGFCYEMDSGNSFDSEKIESIYESPYMPITDSQLRKTLYKLTLYAEPTGQMNLDVQFNLDFDSSNDFSVVQPPKINISTAGSTTATAIVNGTVTSSSTLAVDNNSGNILVGQIVVGTGISGTVKVTGVTNQQNIVLDTAVTLTDNTNLTFITPTASGVFVFGSPNSLYGTGTYGGSLDKVFFENLIGSFKTVSMRITDNSTNPTFTLDTAVLEYRQHDRQ